MATVVGRGPISLIACVSLVVAMLLAGLDAALAYVGAAEEPAIAASLSLSSLAAVVTLEALGRSPMDMFGRSRSSRVLALAVGGSMLILVGMCFAVRMPADSRSIMLLLPGAFFEELLFRGVPLLVLIRRNQAMPVTVGGVVVASIVFAMLHPSQHVGTYVDTFVFSLLAFCIALVARSLWPAVAFHVVANIAATSVASPLNGSDERGLLFVFVDFGLFVGTWIVTSAMYKIVHRRRVSP
ncbi:CPBP family intramembrane glutamic endopeptidase [Sinomonas sp. JGH33]|uniref:CPBP family intramembrane glutamic endopeptidase n=1 Tax=Sinomonas terricola TaxID=3110330 RepID=A0ABU5T8Q9_9MICC|nr:CPBP family intramembrane glutamic endopeptidase [Sinomonas sp. JGH33]MEA5456075.1 CPBP family intramembrane glutamic endopeptidase [Sinomonas sp. JGH33]